MLTCVCIKHTNNDVLSCINTFPWHVRTVYERSSRDMSRAQLYKNKHQESICHDRCGG